MSDRPPSLEAGPDLGGAHHRSTEVSYRPHLTRSPAPRPIDWRRGHPDGGSSIAGAPGDWSDVKIRNRYLGPVGDRCRGTYPNYAAHSAIGAILLLALIDVSKHAEAAVIQAAAFSSTPHAGTLADPWPGNAIKAAIDSLPDEGGTVVVGDGVWLIDSHLNINRGNFNLTGASINARLVVSGAAGQLRFDGGEAVSQQLSAIHLSRLTFDASQVTTDQTPFNIKNCVDCSLTDSAIIGDGNENVAAVLFQGGAYNKILRNSILGTGPHSGRQLQLNPLGLGVLNTGYIVSDNIFDSTSLLIIGQNKIRVNGNYFHNRTLGNVIDIEVAPGWRSINTDIRIDHNILDAGTNLNYAYIHGLSEDPGGKGVINGFIIDSNMVKGAIAQVAAQYIFDRSAVDISDTYNVAILNNTLDSGWVGSKIDIGGGPNGLVDTVSVSRNTLINRAGAVNMIASDGHTYNAVIRKNTLQGSVTNPTVTLAANPTSVESNQSTTLTWTSTNAPVCIGGNFSTGGMPAGSASISPTTTGTYSIFCTGSGSTVRSSVAVTVR